MIPSILSPEVKSTAERRVFEWFKSAPGTDDWIVLHSLGISNHNRVIYGETDFFVLAPNMGLFALEVKGGRVKRHNGIWYFTDKYGITRSKARGPFDQAREGAFSIISAIKSRLDSAHKHLKNVLFSFGVMFPDIEYVAGGIEEEQWQVFDANNAENVYSYISSMSLHAQEKWENIYGSFDYSKLPSKDDVNYLASILRCDFDCAISINAQIRNVESELVRLTKEQCRCLDQLDDNPRCLIQGAAGTGKTLLAIEEAKKATAAGKRVAMFCFNGNLANWLAHHFSKLSPELQPAYVGTLHKFMVNATQKAGNTPAYPHDMQKLSEYFTVDLPAAALNALSNSESQFDEIIVDEAQDLIQDNYLKVLDACLRRGISRGFWTMFGDFSMQAIYTPSVSASDLIDKLEEITSFIRFRLTTNCRNTKPICSELQVVTGANNIKTLEGNVDGPPVQYITWSSMEDQCDKLKSLLNDLHDFHISDEKITILSPRKRENSVVSMLDSSKIADFKIPPIMDITFSTIQAFKGLENTVIILTDIENFNSDKLMYVGLSRATSALYILESDEAKRDYDNLLMRRLC